MTRWPMPGSLPDRIVAAILEADGNLQPARIGVASRDLSLNRNRHTKRPERPTDPRLTVIRFDRAEEGAPIGILVHYTAHPVLTPGEVLKFSADYPGYLQAHVEKELKVPCLFIQGAAGDQSANPPEGKREPESYGELLGAQAVELAREPDDLYAPPAFTGGHDRSLRVHQQGQFQELDHVPALRASRSSRS